MSPADSRTQGGEGWVGEGQRQGAAASKGMSRADSRTQGREGWVVEGQRQGVAASENCAVCSCARRVSAVSEDSNRSSSRSCSSSRTHVGSVNSHPSGGCRKM